MKRFLWIILIFGLGVVALMVASLVLQHQAEKIQAVSDLKVLVSGAQRALTRWDYELLGKYTSDVSKEAFQVMFDDANGGEPDLKRKFAGVLSSMTVFPSVRFEALKPERVDVSYEVEDGNSATAPTTAFKRTGDGYILEVMRFPIRLIDNTTITPIVFHEGDNLALAQTVDRLFNTLMTGNLNDLRDLMTLGDTPETEVRKRLDDLRTQVTTCRANDLRAMLPTMGPVPRGTKWLHLVVLTEVDDRPLCLELAVTADKSPRIKTFSASILKKPKSLLPPPQGQP